MNILGDLTALKNAIDSVIRPKFALLIGIKDPYQTLGDAPVKNCTMLKEALQRTDPSWVITEVLGDQATFINVFAAVLQLLHLAQRAPRKYGCDGKELPPVVLVYYSGHGLQLGNEQYLVPYCDYPIDYSKHGMV